MQLGKRIFNYTTVDHSNGEVKCIHFAKSERDFNTSIRERVERLDAGDYDRPEDEVLG